MKMFQFRMIKKNILYAARGARLVKARGACAARDACF